MKLSDYFLGQRYTLRSPLPAEVVKERINRAAISRFWPFSEGVAGGVFLGRISLRLQGFFIFDYNAKPILTGRLENELGCTILRLKFGAPLWPKIFFGFWYLFLGLFSIMLLSAYIADDPGLNHETLAIFVLVVLLFFAAPVIMHRIGTRNSEEELNRLLEFLASEVQASVLQTDSR